MSYSDLSGDGSEYDRALPSVEPRNKRKRKSKKQTTSPRAGSGVKLPPLAAGGPVNVISTKPELDSDDSVSDLGPVDSASEAGDSVDEDMDYEYSEDEDHVDADAASQGSDHEMDINLSEEEMDDKAASPAVDTERSVQMDTSESPKEKEVKKIEAILPRENKVEKESIENEKDQSVHTDLIKVPKPPTTPVSRTHTPPTKPEAVEEPEKKKKKGGKKESKKKAKAEEKKEKLKSASDRERRGINADEIPSDFEDEYEHTKAGGMKHFGYGKVLKGLMGMARTVVKFTKPPPRFPCTVCFHFPNTFITHRYVMDVVREKIHFVPGGEIVELQFLERNVKHGTRNLENRWLITLNSMECRDELMRLGLFMFNKKILLRRYDEVLMEEYREYLDYAALLKKLFSPEEQMPEEEKPEDEEHTKENKQTKKKGRKKKGKNKEEKKGGGGGGGGGDDTARDKQAPPPEEAPRKVKTPPDFLKDLLA